MRFHECSDFQASGTVCAAPLIRQERKVFPNGVVSSLSTVDDVLLVGYGAMGAIYSFILERGGLARVTAVARSNYDIVQKEGTHILSEKYGDVKGWKPFRVCRSVEAAADRQYSYVILTTKAIPERTKTSHILAPFLSSKYNEHFPQPVYVLIQNGLNVEVELYFALKALFRQDPRIISTAALIGTNLRAPNVVEHNNSDSISIGVYRHGDFNTVVNTPQEFALLKHFGQLLERGGSNVEIVAEVQRKKLAKNFWNVAFSSITTLTNYPMMAIFRAPPEDPAHSYQPFVSPESAELIHSHTIPAIKAILEELVALGRALGFPDNADGLPSSTVADVLETARGWYDKPYSKHIPSMFLDAQKGQPIEVEVILGEVVRMAKERHVNIPRIETLYALLLVVQNQILRKLAAGD